jgi:signal transduction histidine kinase
MPIESSERAALERCALFSSFDREEIEALYESSRPVSTGAGEVLFEEGDPGDSLFVIVAGGVRIVGGPAHGLAQTLASLGPGESFGEMSLLNEKPRSATAITIHPSVLLRVDSYGLEVLQSRRPAAAAKFAVASVRLTSERLRAANARFLQLAALGGQARDQIEQMRSQFLSLVSHELRTPLTVIKTSAQLLQLSADPANQEKGFIDKIENHTERLRLLVDDLILLSMMQARPGIQRCSRFDVIELVEEVVARLAGTAAEKEMRLRIVRRSERAQLAGDRSMLDRALHHLVQNATKFSPSKTEILVTAEALAEGGVNVSVLDQGPGIPAEERDRIFQSFYQEEAPLTRTVGGLGIGLTLVKEVVAAHGGRLEVESEPNQGSLFTIELPAGLAQA